MGVILSWDGTNLGDSFCPGMELLQGNHSVLGWKDSWGVIPFQDRRTPKESFRPRMEQLRGSHSVLVKRILWSTSVLA